MRFTDWFTRDKKSNEAVGEVNSIETTDSQKLRIIDEYIIRNIPNQLRKTKSIYLTSWVMLHTLHT